MLQPLKISAESTNILISNVNYFIFPLKATLEKDLCAIVKTSNVRNGCEVIGEKLQDLMESHGLQAVPDRKTQVIEFYNAKNELVACATAPYELF